MNDNLLVIEQQAHNINYNVGDMYKNYFTKYPPVAGREVKEGTKLSEITLEFFVLHNYDTGENTLLCYFGDLDTSRRDDTFIIYGFIVDDIELTSYGWLPSEYEPILLEKIMSGNYKIGYHKKMSYKDGDATKGKYYLYVQNDETGDFEGGEYRNDGVVVANHLTEIYDTDIVLYQFSFIDSNSGNKKYFVTDKRDIQQLVKSGTQKDALFIAKADVNGVANMSVKISNNDFIKDFDIDGDIQHNLYMSHLIKPSLIMNGDNVPEYKFEGKVVIKSYVQAYDDLSLLPLISKTHEGNINNYDSYYSLFNKEHEPHYIDDIIPAMMTAYPEHNVYGKLVDFDGQMSAITLEEYQHILEVGKAGAEFVAKTSRTVMS